MVGPPGVPTLKFQSFWPSMERTKAMNSRASSGLGAPRRRPMGSTPMEEPPSGVKYCRRDGSVADLDGFALEAAVEVDAHADGGVAERDIHRHLAGGVGKAGGSWRRLSAGVAGRGSNPSDKAASVASPVPTASCICCWMTISKALAMEPLLVGSARATWWANFGLVRSFQLEGRVVTPRRRRESEL